MNADTSNSGAFWLCVGIAFLLGLFVMAGGGSETPKAGTTTTTTTNTSTTQVNVFSVVNNGRVFSNDANTTQNTVSGDRSTIIDAGGGTLCWDKYSAQYTYAACGGQP